MAVTGIEKDFDALTLRLTAEFAAPIEAVWQLWADPRKLERWWGPPTWPATFVDHDLSTGGRATYYMTGPDGTRSAGWWEVESVDPPTSLAFRDGFADTEGKPVDTLPHTRSEMRLRTDGSTTVMTLVSHFASQDAMETMLAMGLEEGIGLSVGQMDAVLDRTTISR
ncbi:MAG: SRPBCC domain-containing protein [Thermomicrobiales bacterium]